MQELSFIHVSDLHLDNFPPVKQENDEIAVLLHEAPYEALQNLLKLCAEKKPAFLIFSGDMYEHGILSLKARFHLTKFFQALEELNIPFYYACGNHDHLGQNDTFFKTFPKVFCFGGEWEAFSFPPQHIHNTLPESTTNTPLCTIIGISHTQRKETANLLKLLKENSNLFQNTPLQIGVLHATVSNCEKIKNTDKHVTALCSEADFQVFPVDYWALGHIHENSVLQKKPFLAYAGAMQATRMSETGSHGAALITIKNFTNSNTEKSISTEVFSLAPLETYVFTLSLQAENEDCANTKQCLEYFLYSFKKAYQGLNKNPLCKTRIFTLFLDGQHYLHKELESEEFLSTLKTDIENTEFDCNVFIRSIQSSLRPCFSYENAHTRDDLLGEVFRVLEKIEQNPNEFEQIFKTIEQDFKIKNDMELGFFAHRDKRSQKQLDKYKQNLLKACEKICINILEPK